MYGIHYVRAYVCVASECICASSQRLLRLLPDDCRKMISIDFTRSLNLIYEKQFRKLTNTYFARSLNSTYKTAGKGPI